MQGTLLVGTNEDGFCSIAYVDGDDLTGAFCHDLQLQLSAPFPSSLTSIKLANPGSPEKWPLKWRVSLSNKASYIFL